MSKECLEADLMYIYANYELLMAARQLRIDLKKTFDSIKMFGSIKFKLK